jgi:hypothetical protein
MHGRTTIKTFGGARGIYFKDGIVRLHALSEPDDGGSRYVSYCGHLPDYTTHTENPSITTTTLLALVKTKNFLYSENQAKYKETYMLWHNTFAYKQLVRTETTGGGSSEDRLWKQYRQTAGTVMVYHV